MGILNKRYLIALFLFQVQTEEDKIDLIRIYLNELKEVKTYQGLLKKRAEFLRGEFVKGSKNKESLLNRNLYKSFKEFHDLNVALKKFWDAVDLYQLVKPGNGVEFDTKEVDKKLEESLKALCEFNEDSLKKEVVECAEVLKKQFGTVRLISFVDVPDAQSSVRVIVREFNEEKQPASSKSAIQEEDRDYVVVYDRVAFSIILTIGIGYLLYSMVKSSKVSVGTEMTI